MGRKLVWDIPLYICGEHGKETGLGYSFKCIWWGWDGNLLGLFH